MKLVLTQSSFWPVFALEDGAAIATSGPSVLVTALEPTLEPIANLVQQIISVERAAFTTIEVVRTSSSESALGWKVDVVEHRVLAGTEIVERRLAYVYFVFELCGAVIFRASPVEFEAEVERARPILASARPEWSGLVALAQLYQ